MIRDYVRIMVVCLVAVFCILVSEGSSARTSLGSGLTSCKDYLQIKRSSQEAGMGVDLWILGYVSGLNFMNYVSRKADLLQDQENRNVISFVEKFCSTNGERTLNSAANEYWIQLSRRAAK